MTEASWSSYAHLFLFALASLDIFKKGLDMALSAMV